MNKTVPTLLSNWLPELGESLLNNNCLCIALFSLERDLVFANPAMHLLLKEKESWRSLVHPDFETLLDRESDTSLVYSGFVTIGNLTSVNTSIHADVYKKDEGLLIIGGVDANQLVDQNAKLHSLNHDINNLQRQLIKEKLTLQKTLAQLNQANIELHNINATKDRLFSIIAHDLRNPFIVLLGFSELLMKNIDTFPFDKIKKYVQNIHDSSSKTFELLMNLLEWSKLHTGLLKPLPEIIYIDAIVAEVKSLCEQHSKSKNISLLVTLDYHEPLYTDKEMLKFILRNLLTNAIKYSFLNSKISIALQKVGNDAHFSISDSGVGIDSEQFEKIFLVDSKRSTAGTSGEKGTGLGLILCKEFVEKLKGKIWVESQKNKGSTFNFTIPLAPVVEKKGTI